MRPILAIANTTAMTAILGRATVVRRCGQQWLVDVVERVVQIVSPTTPPP